MEQSALWHETIFDALSSAVRAAGGARRVSGKLWPNISTSSAEARLRCSLNPEHAQKLDPDELIAVARLGKDAGENCVMEFLARELGYELKPLAPAETKKRTKAARIRTLLEEAMRLQGEE